MSDVYSDTQARVMNDPEFSAAVKALKSIALQHGFTPGELKQIAFRAALEIEMEYSRDNNLVYRRAL